MPAISDRPVRSRVSAPQPIRGRRLTQSRVAAVCEQLGEDLTVRNVQRVLGGSLRDIAPMVKAWRDAAESAAPDVVTSSAPASAADLTAHGKILAAALAAVDDDASDRHDVVQQLLRRVLQTFDAKLARRLERIETALATVTGHQEPVSPADGKKRAAPGAASELDVLKALGRVEAAIAALRKSEAHAPSTLDVDAVAVAKAVGPIQEALQRIERALVSPRDGEKSQQRDGATTPADTAAVRALANDVASLVQATERQNTLVSELLAGQADARRHVEVAEPIERLQETLAAVIRHRSTQQRSAATRHARTLGQQLTRLEDQIAALCATPKKRTASRKNPSKRKQPAGMRKKAKATTRSRETSANQARPTARKMAQKRARPIANQRRVLRTRVPKVDGRAATSGRKATRSTTSRKSGQTSLSRTGRATRKRIAVRSQRTTPTKGVATRRRSLQIVEHVRATTATGKPRKTRVPNRTKKAAVKKVRPGLRSSTPPQKRTKKR